MAHLQPLPKDLHPLTEIVYSGKLYTFKLNGIGTY